MTLWGIRPRGEASTLFALAHSRTARGEMSDLADGLAARRLRLLRPLTFRPARA
jgi:hypothetical protein